MRAMNSTTRLDDGFRHPPFDQAELELDLFLGGLGRGIARAAKGVGRAATAVSRVVSLSQLAAVAARANPVSTLARAAWGGASAGLAGRNILAGAARAALPTALGRFAFDAGRSVLRGDRLASALDGAARAGIADVRDQLRFVQMVAPFVPGVGTGVAAALGAAHALADGRPITDAVVAAARGALPGGALAQGGFDMALRLAQGRSLATAALEAARRALPGGALARAAFDTALAIGQGRRLQDIGLAAVRSSLPGGAAAQQGFDLAVSVARGRNPTRAVLAAARASLPGPAARAAFDAAASARALRASPHAADVLSFARTAVRGRNLQTAALSDAGRQVLARIRRSSARRLR
jgi:hypothetical protein